MFAFCHLQKISGFVIDKLQFVSLGNWRQRPGIF